MPLQKRTGKRWCICVTSFVQVFKGSEGVMESTSNSASTITQTEFVQIVFWNSVQLSDFQLERSPGSLLSGGLAIDSFMALFTTVHTKVVVKAVLALLGGQFPSFLERGTTLSLCSVNFCVTVFRR